MVIEFLTEDKSGGMLIQEVMKKYSEENKNTDISFHIMSYKGVGGIPKAKDAVSAKSEQLLSELPKRLKALQYQYYQRSDVVVFVVVDNDSRDTEDFYSKLLMISKRYSITIDHVFCIAIEEIEAWLLGDFIALQNAYPEVKDRINSKYSSYRQDEICNTWEFLADMLTPKGYKDFKRKYTTIYEIGEKKIEWAEKIGSQMDIRNNRSPSFNRFIDELDRRVKTYITDN